MTLSTRGIYLNRAATELLPETTKYVILSCDEALYVLRILRCAKSMRGKLKLQRLKGGSAFINATHIMRWLGEAFRPRTKFQPRQLENGVALDLKKLQT